jgi:alpha-L-fucosidase
VKRREMIGKIAAVAAGMLACRKFTGATEGSKMIVKPSPQQLAWQELEMGMFIHFGMNTFTDREWGEGTEDPRWFNPTELDARQWISVAKEAGFGYVVLTAKHHDGFCLWQTRYTEHSVKNSPWRNGKGDVVKEVAKACEEIGVKFGFYLSPWDRHEKSYGTPDYDRYFKNQLTELLMEYGEVMEVWFDGAYGGPPGKEHKYDWLSYYEVIRKLQPNALIAICGPDIRWVGNEEGVAPETNWSVQEASHFHQLLGITGKVWYPAECDVSIRPGWFWHAREDDKVKSVEHLLDIYFKSVGRNSVLLLNVPPNRKGLISDVDIQRLREWRKVLDRTFATNFALNKPATASSFRPDAQPSNAVDGRKETFWSPLGEKGEWLEIDLQRPTTFNVAMVQEHIAEGQRVERYRIEAWDGKDWQVIAQGTTIGYKKLDRFDDVTAMKVRLVIESALVTPLIRTFGLYCSER